jgi:hypothetical protein
MIHGTIENCDIDGNGTGYGGIKFDGQAFFSTVNKCRVRDFDTRCISVEGSGSEHTFIDCHVSTTVASAVALYTKQQGTHIIRGEYVSSGANGKAIHFYNEAAGNYSGGFVDGIFIENLAATGYGIYIDGSTNVFQNIHIRDLRASLDSNAGTCVFFGRANYCKLINPEIDDQASGGTLVEWGANSTNCEVICDYRGAIAPVTVDASATRATTRVTGQITRANVTNIQTDSNLTVILKDGTDELPPGFTPAHNGTAWNYFQDSLGNDDAGSYTPPTTMGIARVLNDDEASTMGIAVYNTAAGGAECESVGGGSNFEVATGALAGTTGNDSKFTFSAHTDGKVYIEARKGASVVTILFDATVYGL